MHYEVLFSIFFNYPADMMREREKEKEKERRLLKDICG